ncbi:TonB-dependent receptor, partial [Steroidobacter sp.]|uniref:TonB-dependent receptor n=1 Tax=Steroidobacter sp. TaxID=1978227 RepID=UPI001A516C01
GQAARQGGGSTRAASLRGQAPDLTLVLVNGKRRHTSATLGGLQMFGGGSAADVNTIPVSALRGVEVLLDGASAQYGSDAIAGVLNLQLREDAEGGGLTTTLGQYAKGDGDTYALSGWWGTSLPRNGFLNISADLSQRGATDRSGDDIRRRYFRYLANGTPLAASSNLGTADPREPFGRDRVGQFGNAEVEHAAVLVNAGFDLSDNARAYGWLNFADTDSRSWVQPEVPASDSNVRAIFPDGFQIIGDYYDTNYAALAGVRYDPSFGGQFDFSVGYGRHERDTHNFNLVSPSYGLNSKTDFYLGQTIADQLNVAVDYNRDLEVSWLAKPLAVSSGVAWRKEKWWVSKVSEEQAWNNGGVPILDGPNAGQPARWGAAEQGIAPWDVTEGDRDVASIYVGGDFYLSEKLLLAATVRTEDYSDFGVTTTGKLSARYDLTDSFAFRGSASTGYHAPSIGTLSYQSSGYTSTWNHSGVAPVPNRTRLTRPDDPVTLALGGGPLDPETSRNFSVGFVWRPIDNASVTVDAYRIEIDDRILSTQALTGTMVEAVTAANGIADYKNISFYVNGMDTRTDGVDVAGRYQLDFDQHAFNFHLGVAWHETEVTWVRPNRVTSVDLFQRHQLLNPERAYPEYKAVLGIDWDFGLDHRWGVSVTEQYYGKYTYVHPTNPLYDETYGAKGYTNLEIRRQLTPNTRFSIGADNIFDTYPKQFITANQVNGINRYSFIHPEGANGAFYYARLSYSTR